MTKSREDQYEELKKQQIKIDVKLFRFSRSDKHKVEENPFAELVYSRNLATDTMIVDDYIEEDIRTIGAVFIYYASTLARATRYMSKLKSEIRVLEKQLSSEFRKNAHVDPNVPPSRITESYLEESVALVPSVIKLRKSEAELQEAIDLLKYSLEAIKMKRDCILEVFRLRRKEFETLGLHGPEPENMTVHNADGTKTRLTLEDIRARRKERNRTE